MEGRRRRGRPFAKCTLGKQLTLRKTRSGQAVEIEADGKAFGAFSSDCTGKSACATGPRSGGATRYLPRTCGPGFGGDRRR